MISIRNPLKLKKTPTTKPELLEQWQRSYDELIKIYPKSHVFQTIANNYGVSRPTVIYHLCSAYKEKQKKRPSKMWSYEKNNPIIHERRKACRTRYMAARRHIAELVKESFRRAAPQEALTLGNLRDAIFEISGIGFHPSTLDRLIKQFEATKAHPMLVKISGHEQPHYRLSEEAKN